MLGRAISGCLLIALWTFYYRIVSYKDKKAIVTGILSSFNEILSQKVYAGNRENFEVIIHLH